MTTAVMTFGVAPGASEANVQMTDTDQTALSAFVDADDPPPSRTSTEAAPDEPTPAENAADIARLIDLFQELTDQVGTLVDEHEQRTPTDHIDTDSPDVAERMFQ